MITRTMKHELGNLTEPTHSQEDDPGALTGCADTGEDASGRRLSPRFRRKAEAARSGEPLSGSDEAETNASAEPEKHPALTCLICCSSFLQSTAFSTRNNFNSNYCGRVWKLFCRLLSPQLTAQYWQKFHFEKYPLPFCTDCAKNVIGLTKLQEELELLQATIDFGMSEIREKIKRTVISLVPSEVKDYAATLGEIRSFAFEGQDANRSRQINTLLDGSTQLQYEETEATTETGDLSADVDPLDSSPTPTKRNRRAAPAVESVTVKLDPSQVLEVEAYEFVFEDNYFGSDVGGRDEANLPTTFFNSIDDPKLEALANKLSIRARRNILRKRQQQLKSKGKLKLRKREPFGKVIDTVDGKLMFLNVMIHREEIGEGQTKYRCDLCNSLLKNLQLMRRHIRAAHKNGAQKEYRCKICGKILTNVGSLPRHMAIFHSSTDRPSYSCNLCGKELMSETTLECHKAVVHGLGVEKYKNCDICKRAFRNERNMKQHRLTHMNEEERAEIMSVEETLRIFQCQQCGKELSCAATLKQHMMIHEDVLPFTCDVCGWGFRHKCNLRAHLELHRGDERTLKFKCGFPGCERSYPTRTQLVVHSYSHRPPEDKPFKCVHPGCNLGFTRSYDLAIHRRTHTGERPYKCALCSKTFSRGHHLKRHSNSVHSVNAPTDSTTELITAEIIEQPSNMTTIEFVITGGEGDSFTLPDIKL